MLINHIFYSLLMCLATVQIRFNKLYEHNFCDKIKLIREWNSILVDPPFLKAGLKIRQRAHRWSSLCWLEAPSLGSMLGVKVVGRSTKACGRRPCFRGGPLLCFDDCAYRDMKWGMNLLDRGELYRQRSLPWVVVRGLQFNMVKRLAVVTACEHNCMK